MRCLAEPIRKRKKLRVIGFDDSPFSFDVDSFVSVAGVVCSGTRFEGMLWGDIERDGLDSTDVLRDLVLQSKFHEQVNLILTDGITMAGFNMVDIVGLAESLKIPCVAVMRRLPDLPAFHLAMQKVDRQTERKAVVAKAGEIHSLEGFHFQVAGCTPDLAAIALKRLTDKGDVPESLRLAHLIGAAVKTGESSKRA